MCGLCGVIYTASSGRGADEGLLQRMNGTLVHRGPDAQTTYVSGPVGLGHCRLSIIDLVGGAQPMTSDDGSAHLIFNGEIYNFLELRDELEHQGNRFKTRSDTEVILHLYQKYGEACVDRLRGMFAFAIWDDRKKSLFMARDRFGKKPLVYALLPDRIIFASEMKAILEDPAIQRDLDYKALDLALTYQYVPSPWTIHPGIRKLPPAHTLVWKEGEVRLRRYWEPRFTPEISLSFQDAQEQMMAKLKEATRLRMIADVPIGAFLSGGLDSSIVVGLMSELSSQPIRTFSIGFEEEDFSELHYARLVAKRFGTRHEEFIVRPDALEILPKLVWHYGEPFGDSSALPSYYLSKLTREHVTVSLNGDGGDETFAGYPRYQAMAFMQFWSKMPRAMRRAAMKAVELLPRGTAPHALSRRLRRLMGLGLSDPQTAYLNTLCFFRDSDKEDLYTPFMKTQLQGSRAPDYLDAALERARMDQGVNRFLHTDMLTYLPECLMVKMDIASMAHSLETRSPFLDHELVDLVAPFPSSWKLRGLFQTKYMIRQATRGWLPAPITRRRKQGFGVPLGHWFRRDLKGYLSEMLLSENAMSRDLFQKSGIQRLLNEHGAGRDHSYRLWMLLMVEMWHRVYIDREYKF